VPYVSVRDDQWTDYIYGHIARIRYRDNDTILEIISQLVGADVKPDFSRNKTNPVLLDRFLLDTSFS
jgi:hypothetical protein